MQVLEEEDERLIETLPQEELLERLKRPPPPNLWVHLLEAGRRLFDAQQGKEIGQGVFETAIQDEHLAGDLLLALALVILGVELKVALE